MMHLYYLLVGFCLGDVFDVELNVMSYLFITILHGLRIMIFGFYMVQGCQAWVFLWDCILWSQHS